MAFPRPCGTVPCRPAGSGTPKGQRPTRRGRSARRWRVGRWPGALAPGGPRGSVALWLGRWPLPERPAIPENTPPGGNRKRDPRFPARAGRCPVDRSVQAPRKASARPGGREAPAGGGSGAGRGLWPPAGQGTAQRCGRGDGPCHWNGESACATPGGSGYATRVSPARARRCPVDRQVRDQQKASACRGRVGCWPGALAPGWS